MKRLSRDTMDLSDQGTMCWGSTRAQKDGRKKKLMMRARTELRWAKKTEEDKEEDKEHDGGDNVGRVVSRSNSNPMKHFFYSEPISKKSFQNWSPIVATK